MPRPKRPDTRYSLARAMSKADLAHALVTARCAVRDMTIQTATLVERITVQTAAIDDLRTEVERVQAQLNQYYGV